MHEITWYGCSFRIFNVCLLFRSMHDLDRKEMDTCFTGALGMPAKGQEKHSPGIGIGRNVVQVQAQLDSRASMQLLGWTYSTLETFSQKGQEESGFHNLRCRAQVCEVVRHPVGQKPFAFCNAKMQSQTCDFANGRSHSKWTSHNFTLSHMKQ